MSTGTLRIILSWLMILHGIGHAMGILAIFGIKLSNTHSSHSWLLGNILGSTGSNILSFIVWSLAIAAFLGAGLSLSGWLLSPNLWKTLAMTASIISLVGLIIFWNSFPFLFPNKIGILGIDITLLISLLFLRWPTTIL